MKIHYGLLLLLAGAILSGCGTAAQTAAPVAQHAAPLPSTVPTVAPANVVKTVDGGTVVLGAGRPTALFFMAAWCSDCQAEADAWRQLIERGQTKGLNVLAIDVDPSDTLDGLKKFRAALHSDPLQWAMDQNGQFAKRFNVQSLDTTVILDGSGHEVYRDLSSSSLAQLQQALKNVEGQQ